MHLLKVLILEITGRDIKGGVCKLLFSSFNFISYVLCATQWKTPKGTHEWEGSTSLRHRALTTHDRFLRYTSWPYK